MGSPSPSFKTNLYNESTINIEQTINHSSTQNPEMYLGYEENNQATSDVCNVENLDCGQNTSVLPESDYSSSSEKIFLKNPSMERKEEDDGPDHSILLAVSQMGLCDVSLKRKIYENLMKNEADSKSSQPNYRVFMNIEKSPTLFELEHKKLEELKNACNLVRNSYGHIVNETTSLTDAIQVTEAAIRRLIQMSKKLSSFNRLPQIDQIALLKSSIIEMFCIRATTNFNSENNFWYFMDDKKKGLSLVSMEVLKSARVNYSSHKNFAIKFNSQFRTDTIIVDLLTAIILFRPSRASVSCIDIVKEEFIDYCYLLRRYLQVKYNGNSCVAKGFFLTLIHRLEELYHLSEDIVHLYLDLDPSSAGQLFVELFDLK